MESDPISLLIIALAPGIIWLLYFYLKDRYQPEPLRVIIKLFFVGVIIVVPIGIIELYAKNFFSDFLSIVLIAPCVEETVKFLAVWYCSVQIREFDEPVDGIIYAVSVALGFASIENCLYIFSAGAVSLSSVYSTGITRAVLSVPGHALFSGMAGYGIGMSRFVSGKTTSHLFLISGLALAIFFHSLFNFFLLNTVGVALLLLVLVPFLWWLTFKQLNQLLSYS
jgi:protease PrsW